MAYQIMTLSGFINEVRSSSKGPYPRKFCFVLGAGASKTSGIKTGEELVEIWERELAERNPKAHEAWKQQLGITEKNRGNFYSDYYQRRFSRDNGRRYRDGYNYLEQMMDKARPSGGYVHLGLIMANTMHNVVVTTNFDHLVEDSLVQYAQKMPMVIGHEKLAPYAKGTIARPTVVKIHRDLLMDPISNPEELNKLHDEWVEVLDNLFSHYHPVFIGYAGNDNSVMDFLCNNVDKFNSDQWAFPYWLIYGDQLPEGKVRQFLESSNGYLISQIEFDQVMVELSNALGYRIPNREEYLKQMGIQYDNMLRSGKGLFETLISEKSNQNTRTIIQNLNADGVDLTYENKSRGGESFFEAPIPEKIKQNTHTTVQNLNTDDVDFTKVDEGKLYTLLLVLVSRGEFTRALRYIQHLSTSHDDNHFYHYCYGVILCKVGKYEEALTEINKALKCEPNNAEYHMALASIFHEMRRWDEALAESELTIKLEPSNGRYHNQLGVMLHEMNRFEEAELEKQKAIELEPENAEFRLSLGITLHELGKYKEAVEEKQKATELAPKNSAYFHSLAVTLHAMGQYEKAVLARQKAVELAPDNAEYRGQMAITLLALNRYEDAANEERKAIELNPQEGEYYMGLGEALHGMKEYEQAEKEKREGIRLDPDNPSYYQSLETTLRALGKEEEAQDMKLKALEKHILRSL